MFPWCIEASNGCGFVATEELAEALGVFLLDHQYHLTNIGDNQPVVIDNIEDVWRFVYKGKEYRAVVHWRIIPGASQRYPVKLTFDYIRQA